MPRPSVFGPWCGVLVSVTLAAGLVVPLGLIAGCPGPQPPGPTGPTGPSSPAFNNTTDPTNGGASYIGSAACGACHPDILATVGKHGHSFALNRVEGEPPTYALAGTRAGVPNPPDNKAWTDISYVIGGYTKGAFFVDRDGFELTDGVVGANTQWNLTFPPNGSVAGFVPFMPTQTTPLPYDFTCFRCHVVGAQPQTPANPLSQDGRPGILGTWAEPGVHCEACHGPGSKHPPQPSLRAIFADSSAALCGNCHTAGDDPNVIEAAGGFVNPQTQYPQLLASGGHSTFACGVCHDPHASTTYDRSNGIRNDCPVCHSDQNLAFHANITYQRGDYSEPLTCQSCHMTYVGMQNSAAGPNTIGNLGARMGDVRSHIFRIDTVNGVFTAMFTADGSQVVKDALGRAAVTPDFACLRCHNGVGNAFVISAQGAATIASAIHQNAAAAGQP